ncbi:MAG: polyribonucleotide nucleotidyltransferase, partial [Deltaproteobacteria bacterium]|nr:polyribonucleotide nucleotidyltransferase [Deltaproteobacteria bacterium]
MKESVTVNWGGRPLTLETGRLAKQASGAVLATYGESVVLVTAVASKKPREGIDFFPLSVDYQEMTYAAGKIPGGFFKREGRPGERAILTSRFIDRPLRPLFPKGFRNDVQIIATVLSADNQNDPDMVAMTAASAALEISDIPFAGPIAGVRVGRIGGEFVVNPLMDTMGESELEIIIAGSRDAVVMVEGNAKQVPEQVLLEAIMFGHKNIQEVLDVQQDLKSRVGKAKIQVPAVVIDSAIDDKVRQVATDQIRSALALEGKLNRNNAVREACAAVKEQLSAEFEAGGAQVGAVLETVQEEIVRGRIISDGKRLDGRGPTDIRPIACDVGVLPRPHGSGLFTRGETQALVSVTLGTSSDEQRLDTLGGESFKSFMLHYNFPPFSVNEARPLRGTSRRETGHGALAEKSISEVLPSSDTFPYTIRIV